MDELTWSLSLYVVTILPESRVQQTYRQNKIPSEPDRTTLVNSMLNCKIKLSSQGYK